MSLLRQEYSKTKEKESAAIEEAAMEWLKSNVIPLNEGVERKVLSDLIALIQKFDEKLRPYGEKLPTIMAIITNAENELNQVITGNSHYRSKKRTGELLQSLTGTYNHISDIMRNKIKLILAAPLFRRAREFEDMPLKAVPGLDYELIFSAFKQAMKPTTIQQKLWGKIINRAQYDQMCKEFCELSYKDLVDLTSGMPKVPVVVPSTIEREEDIVSPQVQQQEPMAAEAGGGGVPMAAATPMSQIVAEESEEEAKKIVSPSNADGQIMNEEVLEEQFDASTQQAITQATGIIANLTKNLQGKGFEKTEQALKSLLKDIRNSIQTKSKNLPTLLKQANQVINVFTVIKNSVPKLNQLFADGDFDQEDLDFVKNLLTQAAAKGESAQSGILGSLGRMITGKVQPYQGLSSQDVVNDLLDSVQQYATKSINEQEEQQQQAQPEQSNDSQQIKKNAVTVKQFFDTLQKALTVGLTAPTAQPQQQVPVNNAAPTQQQGQQQAPAPQQQAQQAPAAPKTVEQSIDDLATALNADKGKVISALLSAGLVRE